jgi:hypothetical protein
MSRQKGRESTINGVILPDKWDDLDNVVGVAIETSDGEEYLVESNERANQLLAFVDDAVRATGVIRQRLDGSMTISVKSFETFGPYDQQPEEDDDYDYLDDQEEEWE